MKVDFVNLHSQCEDVGIEDVVEDFYSSVGRGAFMGSQAFEADFAKYHGVEHCVGVGSGTDALWLSLLALGIGKYDQVIVPANTYIATAFAVSHTGATPIFVDPDPETYVMRVNELYKVITPKTKAIIPVHLFGQPAEMSKLKAFADEHGLYVVEDCAQSAGASYAGKKTGTWGDVGAFSFYPTKNLGGLGQGGAIVTNNGDIARKVRELGNVGRTEGSWYDYSHIGFNSRLDAINANFLQFALDRLDEWNAGRMKAALLYKKNLKGLSEIKLPVVYRGDSLSVFHLFEIKCQSKGVRNSLKTYLESKEIGCGLHYPVPCNKQEVYSDIHANCPVSEELSDTLLSLPMHPFLAKNEINYVCDAIKEFFN